MGKITNIAVVGFYTDGGDGGGGFQVYRDREHYLAEEQAYAARYPKLAKYHTTTPEERWAKAEAGDSLYEDGELTNATIEVEEVDGQLRPARSFGLHWGQ